MHFSILLFHGKVNSCILFPQHEMGKLRWKYGILFIEIFKITVLLFNDRNVGIKDVKHLLLSCILLCGYMYTFFDSAMSSPSENYRTFLCHFEIIKWIIEKVLGFCPIQAETGRQQR